jgi:hypothetical protein
MQVTDTVRVVRTAGPARTAFFATVLSVQPPHPDDDGTNGEPTITIGFLDPEKTALLGGPKWHEAFTRIPTVRHISHAQAQVGAVEFCYVEALNNDGGSVHLQRLNMEDINEPAAEADEAPSTIGKVVYYNASNDLAVIHADEGKYVVVSGDNGGVPVHEPFSDLFSAKVYVDAQPSGINQMLADNPGAEIHPVAGARISGSPQHLVDAQVERERAAKEAEDAAENHTDAPLRTVEIGEYPDDFNIAERFSVKVNGIEVERFVTREEAQAYIDKMDSNPPQITPEAITAQNEHDRATGNVNEADQTPAEAVAAEQPQ